VLLVAALAGCDARPADRFVGTWGDDRVTLSLESRGLGIRRTGVLPREQRITWRHVEADTIHIEYGETMATRGSLTARLDADGTLVVTEGAESTALRRTASGGR